ncbi:MAG TPA: glutathione S-transferase family protein [Caulobacteraceae bacterium]|jgi:glutathione S-transferase
MADQLTFYTHPQSRGRIVRWMLEEVGQPYETQVMDYATTLKGPAYLAINPMGKIPAIKHGDTVVTECGAICAYLADAFPAAGLAPPSGDPRRGPYYRWLFFGAGPVESVVITKALGVEVKPEQKRMVGWGDATDALNALEAAVGAGDYLAGDAFSAADLYICASLGWGMQFGAIEKRPTFEAYVERLSQRPAYQRANEIDDKLMAELTPAQPAG